MSILILDLKTFMHKFHEDPWDFIELEENIKHFVYCAKNSGYSVEIIADPHFPKDLNIWKEKHQEFLNENEIGLQYKPHELHLLAEDLFKFAGANVFYSMVARVNVVASYACSKKATILSKSKKLEPSSLFDYISQNLR